MIRQMYTTQCNASFLFYSPLPIILSCQVSNAYLCKCWLSFSGKVMKILDGTSRVTSVETRMGKLLANQIDL